MRESTWVSTHGHRAAARASIGALVPTAYFMCTRVKLYVVPRRARQAPQSRAERSRERSRYSLRTEGSLVCIVHDHVVCTVQCVPGLLCTVVVRDVCSCTCTCTARSAVRYLPAQCSARSEIQMEMHVTCVCEQNGERFGSWKYSIACCMTSAGQSATRVTSSRSRDDGN